MMADNTSTGDLGSIHRELTEIEMPTRDFNTPGPATYTPGQGSPAEICVSPVTTSTEVRTLGEPDDDRNDLSRNDVTNGDNFTTSQDEDHDEETSLYTTQHDSNSDAHVYARTVSPDDKEALIPQPARLPPLEDRPVPEGEDPTPRNLKNKLPSPRHMTDDDKHALVSEEHTVTGYQRMEIERGARGGGHGHTMPSTSMKHHHDDMDDSSKTGNSCCGFVLIAISWLCLILFFPFSLVCALKVVQEYERAVIFRLGRIMSGGAKGPGLFLVLPFVDTYVSVDLRTASYDIPPQEILTKDAVTVHVDAVLYARVYDATMSVVRVEDAKRSTKLLAATTLRTILGTKQLSELLTDRDSIAIQFGSILDEATDPWGIKVERVEVKDVRLPRQMQRAMAAEAESTRDARAKVILADGELKASRSLKEAADVMSTNPASIQLRYLQTLQSISAEKNSTIVFPLPIDVLSGMKK